jgi:hypothetical protein
MWTSPTTSGDVPHDNVNAPDIVGANISDPSNTNYIVV